MFQGTSEDAAFKIITNGFGITSSVDDGYYGRGIYFTSKIDYAAKYCKPAKNKGKVFLLSLVISANSFPVTEHPFQNPKGFLGQACKPGYQTHFTIVSSNKISNAFPVKSMENENEEKSDELVVFEGSQILPLFLIYTTQFDSVESQNEENEKVEGNKNIKYKI